MATSSVAANDVSTSSGETDNVSAKEVTAMAQTQDNNQQSGSATLDEATKRKQLEETVLGQSLLKAGFPVDAAHAFALYLSSLAEDTPDNRRTREEIGHVIGIATQQVTCYLEPRRPGEHNALQDRKGTLDD